jgi:hypothetical protein
VPDSVIDTLSLIMAVALQISLFFVAAELFTDFYNEGAHAASVRYLYFGLEGANALTGFVWTALAMNIVAVVILSIHPLRRNRLLLNVACVPGLCRYLDREGHGLRRSGLHPHAARRDIRVRAHGDRTRAVDRHLGRGNPGLHPSRQGQYRHLPG